jgi:YQGE family putative transporter
MVSLFFLKRNFAPKKVVPLPIFQYISLCLMHNKEGIRTGESRRMKFLQNVLDEKKIPKDLLLLLVISGLYFLGVALSNTFVNVFLWKHTKSFIDIGLYNLMIVIFQPLTFLVSGRLAKKIDRVIVLRFGISFLALFFISVLFLGNLARDFLLLFGILLGIGYGFFWCAFNILTFEITEPDTRDFFNGFEGILSSVGGMIGPAFAGWLISELPNDLGYKWIFALSLALFALAIFISFFINSRLAEGRFYLRRILMEKKNNPNWDDILDAHFVQGIREGTFFFIIGIWVFLTTKSEWALGKFTLIESAIMFLSYYAVSKWVKTDMRKKAILIGGLLLYGSVFLITFKLNYPLLLIYAVVTSIAYPLLTVPFTSLTFDTIGKGWKAKEMRIEYIVVRELYYNLGRIVSILLFLAVVMLFKNDETGIRYLMLVIGAGHLAIYFCLSGMTLKKGKRSIKKDARHPLRDGESGSPV